ncbi:hypothetical protein N0V88_005957 [Collariella sp. IMI 366227]|nr:hypothetical protein N0V88_005957 [Collariella sp. IMI 366227]
MTTDVFRRVGRGGAGNWYSKQDVQNAEKASQEAVRPRSPNLPSLTQSLTRTATNTTTSGTQNYTRAGRGGAGNFTFPTDISTPFSDLATTATQQQTQQELQEEEAERVSKATAAARGRGC